MLGGALIKTDINRILAEATMWRVYLFEGLMGLIAQHSNFLTITASKIMNSIQLFKNLFETNPKMSLKFFNVKIAF